MEPILDLAMWKQPYLQLSSVECIGNGYHINSYM